ncbi:MAG: NTP transferase domain-containing protein, partial [Candidatus Bathyarchaeota archaeon]
ADAVLLVLGDQLIQGPKLINAMIKKMEENRGKALIVSPIYKGKKGHPILFSKELFDEIRGLKENEVIRDIIHKYGDMHQCIEGDQWTIADIDTPKDFEEATRLLEEKDL